MFNPIKFISETRDELKKVSWAPKDKTIRLTAVVIIVSLIVSFYLGFLDIVFDLILKTVLQYK